MSAEELEAPLTALSVSDSPSTSAPGPTSRDLSLILLRVLGPLSHANSHDWFLAMQCTLESYNVDHLLDTKLHADSRRRSADRKSVV